MAFDFSKCDPNRKRETFTVRITASQRRLLDGLLYRYLDREEWLAARELEELIKAEHRKAEAAAGAILDLEYDVEPVRNYIFAFRWPDGDWGTEITQSPEKCRARPGKYHFLFDCDPKHTPKDQEEFERAARFYGVKSPEKLLWIPF